MTKLAIRADDVSVRFGDFEALVSISFAVEEGAFFVVAGPNGGGKSVLLKALLGLLPWSKGQAFLWEKPSKSRDPLAIGYVPQRKTFSQYFPAIGLDLVINGITGSWPARPNSVHQQQALAALSRVAASHLSHKPLTHMSGGELQRVYLARALARRPRLFVLDEPQTGIDTVGEADLYKLLEEERTQRGATVLMVSHDLHAALHHASKVLVLSRTVVAFGSPASALSDEALRRAFGHMEHRHDMSLKHV